MTKEDLPVTPPPRPADPFTAQDGLRLFTLLDSMMKRISSTLENVSNSLALIQKSQIEMSNLMKLIEAESADSRVGRLELEIRKAEREREIAERNLQAIEEELDQKKSIKGRNVDTGEKLKGIAAEVVSDAERKRKETASARLDDLKWTVIKVVITIIAGGATTGIIAFIWFLIQLYLNRGGP